MIEEVKEDREETILIVDDSTIMLSLLEEALTELYFTKIIKANNGVKALKVLNSQKIDLIMTDWSMPEMDGLTLVKNIKSNPDLSEIPIIMITTKSNQEYIVKAIKAGVNDYIIKTFTAEIIRDKIDKLLH